MSAAAIIRLAILDGILLVIKPEGQLHYSGNSAAVSRWLPVLRQNKTEILVALARVNGSSTREDEVHASFSSRWWQFCDADGNQKEACYCPPVTYPEALTGEPDAIYAKPFEPIRRRPNEPLSEEDEVTLRIWLANIDETDEETIGAVLNQCQTDKDARAAFLHQSENSTIKEVM